MKIGLGVDYNGVGADVGTPSVEQVHVKRVDVKFILRGSMSACSTPIAIGLFCHSLLSQEALIK